MRPTKTPGRAPRPAVGSSPAAVASVLGRNPGSSYWCRGRGRRRGRERANATAATPWGGAVGTGTVPWRVSATTRSSLVGEPDPQLPDSGRSRQQRDGGRRVDCSATPGVRAQRHDRAALAVRQSAEDVDAFDSPLHWPTAWRLGRARVPSGEVGRRAGARLAQSGTGSISVRGRDPTTPGWRGDRP